ncbi:MAG: L,D-transpeptidase family protein [Rhodothermales bacterium]
MTRLARVLVAGLLGLAGLGTAAAQPLTASDLRAALARQSDPAPDLAAFYDARDYAPAWLVAGHPTATAHALADVLAASAAEGLRPADYHANDLRRSIARGGALTASEQARLDVLLSDAFLRYARDQRTGRVRPDRLYDDWDEPPRTVDPARLLADALRAGRVEEGLAALPPPHAGYTRLRRTLARYRAFAEAGGWPTTAPGPTLRLGDRDARIATLRRRLRFTDDLRAAADTAEAPRFDAAVDAAVRTFQHRHGLDADGVVGPKTQAALDVPAADRVRQIELNMERWRWLPRSLGREYVLIDVPSFRLEYVRGGGTTLVMRVIVGTVRTPTPAFASEITHVVLSPYWHVPYSIATAEILPHLRRSASYLARHHMTLLRNGRRVDPYAVDWSAVSARRFPYAIRQDPGPDNPLGPVKFLFENRFGVRLHGTSNPELFARTDCALSHGCIRAERPIDLAAALLRADTAWTAERMNEVIAVGEETRIALADPVPIHVRYWTAWVDETGTVHFAPDLYGRDHPLADALRLVDGS